MLERWSSISLLTLEALTAYSLKMKRFDKNSKISFLRILFEFPAFLSSFTRYFRVDEVKYCSGHLQLDCLNLDLSRF
mgnify:CR=1 FL=1